LADHCQPKHHDCDPWTEKLLVMISGEGGWGKAEHPQLPKTAPTTTGSNLVPIDRSNCTLLNGNLHASLFCKLVYDTLIPNTNNQSSRNSRTLERTRSTQYIWDRKHRLVHVHPWAKLWLPLLQLKNEFEPNPWHLSEDYTFIHY